VENQHKMIPGYRDWDEGTTGIIAGLKSFLNTELNDRVDLVKSVLMSQLQNVNHELMMCRNDMERATSAGEVVPDEVLERQKAAQAKYAQINEAQRWLAMARTDFQTGAMKLIRAVAQPTTEY
jgi:hypothetical protein